ncbi:hypothetical protein SAMD00019534_030700 [Acytostelium subglobosum LB1]|uniref:hypothetical protein n=1 Tax=Acytostelium subglobosum LB1 TaxID=1410327 RepID=UPI000644D1A6|nr:hypothetical protein SAMD00019534_030700 [Acytostelium subglobosum LB1]GAM19895.1 hypothetical protein SAMD00019534_030700 [Acytostelium subglobosum LB1]|eukprot:XP_012756657.1 hypothetical protein SAMD00019534_030700 [Acytostelium subglobosum LB1]
MDNPFHMSFFRHVYSRLTSLHLSIPYDIMSFTVSERSFMQFANLCNSSRNDFSLKELSVNLVDIGTASTDVLHPFEVAFNKLLPILGQLQNIMIKSDCCLESIPLLRYIGSHPDIASMTIDIKASKSYYSKLIEALPANLQHLTIDQEKVPQGEWIKMSRLTKLKTINFISSLVLAGPDFIDFLVHNSSLVSLAKVRIPVDIGQDCRNVLKNKRNITSLNLVMANKADDPSHVDLHSDVTKLRINCEHGEKSPTNCSILGTRNALPHLAELRVSSMCPQMEEELIGLVGRSESLRVLKIDRPFDEEFITRLLDSVMSNKNSSLQVLSFRGLTWTKCVMSKVSEFLLHPNTKNFNRLKTSHKTIKDLQLVEDAIETTTTLSDQFDYQLTEKAMYFIRIN